MRIIIEIKKNRCNRIGERNGYWECYRGNGKLMSKGSYKNGERDGYWEWYWDNGELYSKGNYVNGVLICEV